MFSKQLVLAMFLVMFAATFLDHVAVEARYLPTRSNGERIDKLKELLRELLENEIEKDELGDVPRWHPESRTFYKREAKPAN
ncbi:uncharacterized protein LOC109605489 [Aethina tumida]|uniref:uncharacterized protein LOC109605489 n=1 Tax=Aethina tumida TaxID=116153 RepID=UPI00096B1200|nr:uncharacterized protein LOC109605489 [Aethina tumida]